MASHPLPLYRHATPIARLGLILLLALGGGLGRTEETTLHIAAARSATDSGLVQRLATDFQQLHPQWPVVVEAVGALQALDLGREGRADLIITHHPFDEEQFIDQGHGLLRTQFMYGEYTLFGPPGLLPKFANSHDITQVLHTIAREEYPFLAPSPRSGTYRKIEELWALAGLDPAWVGYENTNSSASATLDQANAGGALTIADSSLYYTQRQQFPDLVPLYRGDIVLRNTFDAIVVNAALHPGSDTKAATAFLDYLVSAAGQQTIRDYSASTFSTQLYTPSAHLDLGLAKRLHEEELTRQHGQLIAVSIAALVLVVLLATVVYMSLRLDRVYKLQLRQEFEQNRLRYDRDLAVQASRIKDEFISVVSHELRTPLTSIIGALSLLDQMFPDIAGREKELIQLANRNSGRLLLVINDLLDIEKLESGSLNMQLRRVSLSELIQESLANNAPYADKYGVHYRYLRPEHDCTVMADRDRLLQIFANLLSNAAKYAPRDSDVVITCEERDGRVRVAVSDEGPGIPDEYKEAVFEKFVQVDSSTRREKGGTGLGLAITRALVERHHGSLGVEDNRPHGARFYVELPVVTAA